MALGFIPRKINDSSGLMCVWCFGPSSRPWTSKSLTAANPPSVRPLVWIFPGLNHFCFRLNYLFINVTPSIFLFSLSVLVFCSSFRRFFVPKSLCKNDPPSLAQVPPMCRHQGGCSGLSQKGCLCKGGGFESLLGRGRDKSHARGLTEPPAAVWGATTRRPRATGGCSSARASPATGCWSGPERDVALPPSLLLWLPPQGCLT